METINQKKSYIVLRPLLFLSKDRIQELCKQCDIPYLIDPTNSDSEISDRNFLRITILPQLYTLGQGKFIESIQHLYTLLESQKKTSSLTVTPLTISPYW